MNLLKLNLDECLQFARDRVSEYCINECNALCCKNGIYIQTIDPDEVRMLLKLDNSVKLKDFAKEDERLDIKRFGFVKKGYNVLLDPCIYLEDRLCSIYNDVRKPKICSQYPIIKDKLTILLSSKCPAVKQLKIEDALENVTLIGYDINYF